MRAYRNFVLFSICASLSILGGCGKGDGLNRVIISGAVSLQSVSVADGQIRYIPIDGTAGPTTVAPIRSGTYTCSHKGGVPVGKHRVEILVWDPSVPPPMGPGGPIRPQWAPEKYNRESELVFEVDTSAGAVVKDWEL